MKIALCVPEINVPAKHGVDVHVPGISRALIRRGHDVTILWQKASGQEQLGVPNEQLVSTPETAATFNSYQGILGRRFAGYFGISQSDLSELRSRIVLGKYDACIHAGADGLAWLQALGGCARIWYPADELVLLTSAGLRLSKTVGQASRLFMDAVALGVYERGLRNCCSAAWVVSETDQRRMNWFLGRNKAVSIPNGVDLEYFTAPAVPVKLNRIAFWGNLGFAPNRIALQWFMERVWGPLKERVPAAEFVVIGRGPDEWTRRLCDKPDVTLMADVPDLRAAVCSAAIAVLPMQAGGGIKNKLLEAASMRRAIVASPLAVKNLYEPANEAWKCCQEPEQWVAAIQSLMADGDRAQQLGVAARAWVETDYSWDRAAGQAEESLKRAIAAER